MPLPYVSLIGGSRFSVLLRKGIIDGAWTFLGITATLVWRWKWKTLFQGALNCTTICCTKQRYTATRCATLYSAALQYDVSYHTEFYFTVLLFPHLCYAVQHCIISYGTVPFARLLHYNTHHSPMLHSTTPLNSYILYCRYNDEITCVFWGVVCLSALLKLHIGYLWFLISNCTELTMLYSASIHGKIINTGLTPCHDRDMFTFLMDGWKTSTENCAVKLSSDCIPSALRSFIWRQYFRVQWYFHQLLWLIKAILELLERIQRESRKVMDASRKWTENC